jgi:hypothetical protein
MKSKQLLCTLLLSLAGLVQAQTTTYWIGNNDNSLTATGVQAQNYQNGGWKDVSTFELVPNTVSNTSPNQFSAPSFFGGDRAITVYGFNSISGFTATDVQAASIYGNINEVFYLNQPSGNAVIATIRGLESSQRNFSEGTANWNNLNNSHFTTSYGTFSIDPNIINGSWFGVDVTNALKDYLNGTIGGIAFEVTQQGESFTGSDIMIQFQSQENTTASLRPGMMVNVAPVPEPSGALLGGLAGMIGLLRRRRPAPRAPQP